MKVAITGSSGDIGSELIPFLNTGGHEVVRLVRSRSMVGESSAYWNPAEGELSPDLFQGVDAVINLSGENVSGGRWTAAKKERLRDSRIRTTELLAETLAGLDDPPEVLLNSSAVGFYGDRGDESVDESCQRGSGLLPDVCAEWEAATRPAQEKGIRTAFLRFGVVLSPAGGALSKMLLPFKMCIGGVIGNGRQYMSWISIDDAVGAIYHLLMNESIEGPVNIVSPNPVTNRDYTKTLGKVISRPTILPMPAFAARLAFGEKADELLLLSTKVEPARLNETDFDFRFPNLEDALRHLLKRA
ncbi:MAG: TIGR01777 family oxidoreductase [Planctomycetota bacterium]|jgi:hypothetical protein|nr:TIGR01777 family oxidoreductase [Planctomycetota bacterium]